MPTRGDGDGDDGCHGPTGHDEGVYPHDLT